MLWLGRRGGSGFVQVMHNNSLPCSWGSCGSAGEAAGAKSCPRRAQALLGCLLLLGTSLFCSWHLAVLPEMCWVASWPSCCSRG